MNIVGVKGICKIKNQRIDTEIILGDLLHNTSDFILDIEIVSDDSSE